MKKISNKKIYISSVIELMNEWYFPENIGKDPTKYEITSKEIVYWKCKNGHIYQETIYNKFAGELCQACNKKKIIVGLNDLATMKPKLAQEWDYEKNGDLRPTDVLCASNQKAWWICEKKHSWEAVISSRYYGANCPYCAGRRVEIGFNDLETTAPNVAKQWNYEKNGAFKPNQFTKNSNQTFWWKCEKGHEWETTICARTRGNGCPYCAGHKAIPGLTDLKTKNPKLLIEWNYEKNIDVSPEQVTFKSHLKVWWRCKKGHEWKATIASRTGGNGCPYCSGRMIVAGINDLETIKPQIAKQWNYERNGELKPSEIGAYTNKYVWWKCEKGQEWETSISNRARRDSGCPICNKKEYYEGLKNFKVCNPTLAMEWNYDLNTLTPDKVENNSLKIFWWKCVNGHNYKASVISRIEGYNCPYCRGKSNL